MAFTLQHAAYAALPPEQLNGVIQEKSRELEQIQSQLNETQKNLAETEHKSTSLKQEIGIIQKNIGDLALGIKKNETYIQKLSLEIDQLNYAIEETKQKITDREAAIKDILREMQGLDDENSLLIFLKNKTLAEGVDAHARLDEIGANLSVAIRDLKALNEDQAAKLNAAADKKKGITNEYQTLKVRKSLVAEQQKNREQILITTKNKEKEFQKIIGDLEKRQADIASEIEAMEAELRLKINPDQLPAARSGVLEWPVAALRRITQEYGATSFAVHGGYRGKWHNGVDIGGPFGTPILASEKGTVVNTGNQDLFCRRGAYGKYVVIRHLNNLITLYAHLSTITATPGMPVNKGDIVGYLGNTGYSKGPHLHFTVYDAATFSMRGSRTCGPMPSGGDLDPQKYL